MARKYKKYDVYDVLTHIEQDSHIMEGEWEQKRQVMIEMKGIILSESCRFAVTFDSWYHYYSVEVIKTDLATIRRKVSERSTEPSNFRHITM